MSMPNFSQSCVNFITLITSKLLMIVFAEQEDSGSFKTPVFYIIFY